MRAMDSDSTERGREIFQSAFSLGEKWQFGSWEREAASNLSPKLRAGWYANEKGNWTGEF